MDGTISEERQRNVAKDMYEGLHVKYDATIPQDIDTMPMDTLMDMLSVDMYRYAKEREGINLGEAAKKLEEKMVRICNKIEDKLNPN